jgi:hypothetical protein
MKAVDTEIPQQPRLASTCRIELQGGTPTAVVWIGAKAYVSYAVPLPGSDAGTQYYRCYYKTADFSAVETPVISEAVNIPGYVAGLSLDGKYLYTVDYQYAAAPGYGCDVYLNTLEPIGGSAYLRDREKIVSAAPDGRESYYCGSVAIKNERAYYVINHTACADDYSSCTYDSTLVAADLSDPANIQFPSSRRLEVQSADLIGVVQNTLFLYAWSGSGGMLIYGLADPGNPQFENFYRTDYYPGDIRVIRNAAYLPSGMYGVKVIPLH